MYNNLKRYERVIPNSKLNISNCKNKLTTVSIRNLDAKNYSSFNTKINNYNDNNIILDNNTDTIFSRINDSILKLKEKSMNNTIFYIISIALTIFLLSFFSSLLINNYVRSNTITSTKMSYSHQNSNNISKISFSAENLAPKSSEILLPLDNSLNNNTIITSATTEQASYEKNISKYDNVLASSNIDISNISTTLPSEKYIKIEKPKLEYLPDYFSYTNINESKLRSYLSYRNSKLAEEPYFSQIISVSKRYNLNPLVMFAITGQEQSFVPNNTTSANRIANNPFNVHGSWQNYNTTIADSTEIAAKTVINLSKGRPSNVDPFTWINRKYASDPNWNKGVRDIYNMLVEKTN